MTTKITSKVYYQQLDLVEELYKKEPPQAPNPHKNIKHTKFVHQPDLFQTRKMESCNEENEASP